MAPTLRWNDSTVLTGLIFIMASIIVFLWPLFSTSATDTLGYFALNFILAAGYFFIALVSGKLNRKHENIHVFLLFLVLALISAYSLNREMGVFERSTTWMCVILVTCSINYIGFAFFLKLPVYLRHLMCFILGIATLLFIYLSLYLLPLYGIGLAAFFLLGISLHTFVPLLFSVFSLVLLRRIVLTFSKGLYSFLAGVLVVLAIAGYFIFNWNNIVSTINDTYRKQIAGGENSLPAWVRVSQVMEAGPITERVLKAGLSYSIPAEDWNFMRMPQRNFGDQQKHDPLVMISAMTTERVQLSEDERINILRSLYDSRHQAEQRLWSGENLATTHVHSNVKLWPKLRLAYTEKIVTVTNRNTNEWGSSEEAIYTFHLPEGGVVTSLSLWIDGKEEKAILTTKEKAATAYNTIVGVEVRDPSVVHWQEGNRVSVRVFPVLPLESRMFKVGITSPLLIKTGDLVYDNIWFDGPLFHKAKEDAHVAIKDGSNIIVPSFFEKTKTAAFAYTGKYKADWNLSCAVMPVANDAFSFDGDVYTVQEYVPKKLQASFNHVYLDINGSWPEKVFQQVWDAVKDKQVYAYVHDSLQQLNEENYKSVFQELKEKRFSLFPFYTIKEPAHSLVITHNGDLSPNLEELKGTGFLQQLQQAYSPGNRYRLFNLSTGLSPFVASLHEKRYFDYAAGNPDALELLLKTSVFPVHDENEQQVIIHQAGIKLQKQPGSVEVSIAPDHLMRMFAYNHIMQQLGKYPAPGEQLHAYLAEVARKAYIVSPVTSLVVLETKRDYERFNIKDEGNSLGNASMKSNGAVPEPHEWVLIILAALVLLYVRFPHLFKRMVWRA